MTLMGFLSRGKSFDERIGLSGAAAISLAGICQSQHQKRSQKQEARYLLNDLQMTLFL